MRMVGGAVAAVTGKVGYAVLAYLNLVLAARLLGPDDFGLFMLVVTATGFLGVIGSFGSENTILATVPRALPDDVPAARATLGAVAQLVLLVSAALAVVLAVVPARVASLLGQPEAAPFVAVLGLSLPFVGLQGVSRAAAQSVHAFGTAVFTGALLQAAVLAVAYGIATLVQAGPVVVAWMYTGSFVIAATVGVAAVARRPALGWSWLRPGWRISRTLAASSLQFVTIQGFTNLKSAVIVFVLGLSLSAGDIGQYSAAQRTASLASFVLVGVNLVFAPLVAALWGRGEQEALARTYRRCTKWTIAVSLPMCVLMVVAGPGLLGIFGPSFRAAAPALAWLAAGQFVNAATGSVGYLLLLTGGQRLMLWNTIGATVMSGVAAWLVAPRFGVVGAAAVGGGVVALFNIVMLAQVNVRMRMQPYDGETLRVLLAGALALAGGLPGYSWAWREGRPLAEGLLATAGVAVAVYGAAFTVLGLSPEDRRFLGALRASWRRGLAPLSAAGDQS